jgi:ankyrin repeat protein
LTLLNTSIRAEALNSYGQTFLHLLNIPAEIEQYIEILRRLTRQASPFPFLHKDHYGFTILHRFILSTVTIEAISLEHMSEIHALLGNQQHKVNKGFHEVVEMELDFEARFASLDTENWASGDKDITIELDKHGNTCLIAVLKMWSTSEDLRILLKLINQLTTDREFIVNVNAYDRNGNTALAIAARRGLCLAVERLLVLGANPNATNYHRESILHYVQTYRHAARRANDDRLYADILACEKMLVESGAMLNVTALDEFSVGKSVAVEAIQEGPSEVSRSATRKLSVGESPYWQQPLGPNERGAYETQVFACYNWNYYNSC